MLEFIVFFPIVLVVGGLVGYKMLIKKMMTKQWRYRYGTHEILIKTSTKDAELYVDGEMQDKLVGTIAAGMENVTELKGKLSTGEEIRTTFGGSAFSVLCVTRIDNKVQKPI